MFFMSILMSVDTIRQIQAQDKVKRIVKSGTCLFHGLEAKFSIEVVMLGNVKELDISGNRILIRIEMTEATTTYIPTRMVN